MMDTRVHWYALQILDNYHTYSSNKNHSKQLLELLYSNPKVNSKIVCENLGITPATANGLLKTFVEIGILEEKTGFNRNRYYVFEDYIRIFR